ncbi:MAG: NAD(P)-binding protein [Nitriliruptoraceae bacterium]
MRTMTADYLVIGAGATGMAFTDALVADSDATVVMVDRRHAPGGHWNDAYPFVRLHQPSAIYGVNSVALGHDRIDESGLNAGFYEQATAAEICAYYRRVLEEQLVGSGQVSFLGAHEHVGQDGNGHRLISRVTGQETAVQTGKVVDATYLDTQIPSRHVPDFEVEPGARVVTPDALVDLAEPGEGFTVLGAGKTAMDTCTWLLEQGVEAVEIRWVRPRDAWVLDRAFVQPLELVGGTVQGLADAYQAAAEADDLDELYGRAEACGQIHRLDPEVEPDMHHGATLSAAERQQLATITQVIRKGRVRRVGVDALHLDEGSVPTPRQEVHVDCTARGLGWAPPRPIFEEQRITPQPTRFGMLPFSAALIGFLETTERDEDDKNRLTRPNPLPRTRSRLDWAWATYIGGVNEATWRSEPDIQAWLQRSRLNIGRAVPHHLDDEQVQAARARIGIHGRAAITSLARLLQDDPVRSR